MAYRNVAVKLACRLTLNDGTTVEVTTSLADTLALERAKGRAPEQTTIDALWLAWHAAARERKVEARQFDRFAASVVSFEIDVEEAANAAELDADDLDDGAVEIADEVGADPTGGAWPAG